MSLPDTPVNGVSHRAAGPMRRTRTPSAANAEKTSKRRGQRRWIALARDSRRSTMSMPEAKTAPPRTHGS